jgi:hypothetical protein
VVNIVLAVFDPVFVSNPIFKSTSAQNKSCRSYSSLQLLFWPNFMFQCKIWSFGRSKSAKNHSNSVTVPPRLVSASPASTLESPRVALTNLAHRAHTPILIHTESCSFSPSLSLPRAHAEPSSSSVPSPASPLAKLAAPSRFAAPRATQHRPEPPPPHLEFV